MALANTPMLLITLLMAFCGVCFGEIYQVGDSTGWTNNGVNYTLWASYRNFLVGDVLHFKYDKNESNVARVLHKEFRSCNPEHEIYKLNTGDDYIRLDRPGNFFFISSVNGHCQSGQKLHVSVSNKSAPSVSPGSTAPTPTPVPSSRPTQGPVSSSTSPIGAPEAAPVAAPKAAPVAAPKAAPVAAPKASATAAPIAAPKAALTPKNAPIAAPTSEFDGPPTPPDGPINLIPAPKAAPPSPPKSSAQSIQSSMPFFMAIVFIAYIVV